MRPAEGSHEASSCEHGTLPKPVAGWEGGRSDLEIESGVGIGGSSTVSPVEMMIVAAKREHATTSAGVLTYACTCAHVQMFTCAHVYGRPPRLGEAWNRCVGCGHRVRGGVRKGAALERVAKIPSGVSKRWAIGERVGAAARACALAIIVVAAACNQPAPTPVVHPSVLSAA